MEHIERNYYYLPQLRVQLRLDFNSEGDIHEVRFKRGSALRGPEPWRVLLADSATLLTLIEYFLHRNRFQTSSLNYAIYQWMLTRRTQLVDEQVDTVPLNTPLEDISLTINRPRRRSTLNLPAGWDVATWHDLSRNYRHCWVKAMVDDEHIIGQVMGTDLRRDGTPVVVVRDTDSSDDYTVPLTDIIFRPEYYGLINHQDKCYDVSYHPLRNWRRGINEDNTNVRNVYRNSRSTLSNIVTSLYTPLYYSFENCAQKAHEPECGWAFNHQLGVVYNHINPNFPIIKNRRRAIGLLVNDTVYLPPTSREYIPMLRDHTEVEVRE